MNAMIFAAGLGTRLRPLTNDRPKALVEVNGKTLLEHNILKLRAAGFDHVVVNVHHFGEQIISFLQAHDNFGIDIRVSDERQLLLDTGGGIKAALSLFADPQPILIHNVDIISDIDLRALYQTHQAQSDAAATLAVNQRQTQRYLLFDQRNQLCGWTNTATGQIKPAAFACEVEKGDIKLDGLKRFAFSGIHVVDPRMFATLQSVPAEAFPIMDFYLENSRKLRLYAHEVTGTPWVDCGKPESLVKAEQILSGQID